MAHPLSMNCAARFGKAPAGDIDYFASQALALYTSSGACPYQSTGDMDLWHYMEHIQIFDQDPSFLIPFVSPMKTLISSFTKFVPIGATGRRRLKPKPPDEWLGAMISGLALFWGVATLPIPVKILIPSIHT